MRNSKAPSCSSSSSPFSRTPFLLIIATAALSISSATGEGPAGSKLRPQSDLTSNCFGFPADGFTVANSIRGVFGESPTMMMSEGQAAIDFTLHDDEGRAWNLRDALEGGGGKPVVMIWGMFTCPAFQGMGTTPPWEKCGYRDQYDLVELYKDRATFVHLYGAEPHPSSPGTNFDSGNTVTSYWSVVPQHSSYEARLGMVARIRGVTHPAQVILPDYFPGNPYSELVQPVWCSYSLGARPAMVISPDGTVLFQQTWLQTEDLAGALDAFWAGGSDGSEATKDEEEEGVEQEEAEGGQEVEHGGEDR